MVDASGGPGAAGESEPGSVHVLLGRNATRVVLTGDVDAGMGTDLLEATADAEMAGKPVEVDVQHVTFMDSTGVAFLARLASRSPRRLVLIKPPEVVRFLMTVTNIRQVLDVVESDPGFDGPGFDRQDDHPEGPDDPDDPDDIVA